MPPSPDAQDVRLGEFHGFLRFAHPPADFFVFGRGFEMPLEPVAIFENEHILRHSQRRSGLRETQFRDRGHRNLEFRPEARPDIELAILPADVGDVEFPAARKLEMRDGWRGVDGTG